MNDLPDHPPGPRDAQEGRVSNSSGGAEEQQHDSFLGPRSDAALRAVIPHHMHAISAALYARWWQLETWMRDLVYVELRALLGIGWQEVLPRDPRRRNRDIRLRHMASPDNENPLAYLDYSQLLAIVEERWELFEPAMLERDTWRGRQTELAQIRHRIGHMRRPHEDDLGRLEQTLRDLERGAFITYASYNDRRWVDAEEAPGNPVVDGWLLEHHDDARRLIAHADQQYEVRLVVDTSRRPWADHEVRLGAGTLWHATFIARGRPLDVPAIWRDVVRTGLVRLIVLLEAQDPHRVTVTFAGVDDAKHVADAIGIAFDAVLSNRSFRQVDWERISSWQARMRSLDYRVASGDGWTIVTPDTIPISQFGAGAGVDHRPTW